VASDCRQPDSDRRQPRAETWPKHARGSRKSATRKRLEWVTATSGGRLRGPPGVLTHVRLSLVAWRSLPRCPVAHAT
jgi:hypothetical protein